MWYRRTLLLLMLCPCAFSQTSPAPTAVLGAFSEQTIEDEGKIARLDITAQVHVNLASTYRLTFELTAPDGRGITGEARAKLEPGDRSLTAPFPAQQIRDFLGQDGPYIISAARLVGEIGGNRTRTFFADTDAGPHATRAYRLSEFYQNPYSLTGEFNAQGIDVQPSGKFGALRVRFGIATPGANCSAVGTLEDQKNAEIDFENSIPSALLPAGKGFVDLTFPGPKIVAHGQDGPFVIPGVTINCRRIPDYRPAYLETRTRFTIPGFRTADFDTPADFALSLFQGNASYRVPAGATVPAAVTIQVFGLSDEPVSLEFHSAEPKLTLPGPGGAFSCVTCYQAIPHNFSIQVAEDIKPGEYPVEVVGRRNGRQHSVRLVIVVDREMTRQVRANRETLATLVRPDPPPSPTPKITVSPEAAVPNANLPRFSAGIALRKIHAVLVVERSLPFCDVASASAIRFARLLVEGRDSLAVINLALSAQTIVPLSDRYPSDLDDRLKKLPCGILDNTGAALKLAYWQLAEHHDPEAIDAVILIAFGPPFALTAEWNVNQSSTDSCKDAKDGRILATAVPRYLVTQLYPLREAGPTLYPVDVPARPSLKYAQELDARTGDCLGDGTRRPGEAVTSIPEFDADGIALTGSFPLQRWPSGPHANEIRIDRPDNIRNAAANQVENIAQKIRSQPNSALIYAVAAVPMAAGNAPLDAAWPEALRRIANDPGSASFRPDQPAGLAIVIDKTDQVWPAFERIRRDILDHAAVK